MASVRGSHPKMHKKGKIRHMMIKPAKNGFTSEVSRERTPEEAAGPYMGDRDEPPTIHPSISHLKKHIASTFAPGEPDADDMPA